MFQLLYQLCFITLENEEIRQARISYGYEDVETQIQFLLKLRMH